MSVLFCLQLTLTIVRQTGGLGISIAGGKGSTPYKGEDEVSPPLKSAGCHLPCTGPWIQLHTLPQGIFISRVSEEGPAARAGVRVGDKLLEVSEGLWVHRRADSRHPHPQSLAVAWHGHVARSRFLR